MLPGGGPGRQPADGRRQALRPDSEKHLPPRPPAGDEAGLLKDGQVLRDRLAGDGQQRRQAARARAGPPAAG